jgi:SRSO17 transposase
MPRIGKFPPFGKRFFRRARKLVGRCSFEHFWRAVVLIASMQGRRSLSRMQEASGQHCSRQAIAYFLNDALWNAPELLRDTALATLQQLGFGPGDVAYVIFDDTQKRKRGKKMAAVSKIFLHAERVFARGHTIVGCVLVYRGVIIPYAVNVYATQAFCTETHQEADPSDHVHFRKLTQMAADLLGTVTLPKGGKGIALFDSYYLCPVMLEACAQAKMPFISVAKKNRNFAPDGRPRDKRKLGTYGRNVLQRAGRWQKVQGKKHCLAQRVGTLSKAGRVKLVFSRRPGEKAWVALTTNETRWSMATVLRHYFHRWPIEVFFKMSKQHLGLGDYQVLRYQGVVRYLHLVLIAYLLLTHLALNESSAKAALKGKDELRLPSTPELQTKLRAMLWDDFIAGMEKSCHTQAAARKLKEALMF